MEFISEKILPILKLNDVSEFNVKYIFDNVHPDDKDRFIRYEQKVTEFFNNLKREQITKYKVIYDYRIRKTDGSPAGASVSLVPITIKYEQKI